MIRVLVQRIERGYYQLSDSTGLPEVTLFVSEDKVDAMEDPGQLSVVIFAPGTAESPVQA